MTVPDGRAIDTHAYIEIDHCARAIDILNATPDCQIWRLEDDADVANGLLAPSGFLRYPPKAEARRLARERFLDEVRCANYPANPDPEGTRAYFAVMAERVNLRGPYCEEHGHWASCG